LAFEIWRTTAATFAIRRLLTLDGLEHPWSRRLPPPAALRASPPSISAVLLNRDGGDRLLAAIESVRSLADEVLVVDDGSTDGSPERAVEQWDVQVVERALDGDFASQRNHGIERASSEWVLMIDADERLEPGLEPLLRRAVRNDRTDVVFLPRLNHVVGRGSEPVSWPDYQGRLFRRHLRFEGRLHEQLTGWRRPVHLPLSGPFLVHRKTLIEHYRSSLLYDELDPNSPYPPDLVAEMRDVVRGAGEDAP
jgi:glycosyltransferase involved in cell wall biosynthesis